MLVLLFMAALQAEPLVRDLEDDSPEVRDRAVAKLRQLGPAALPALKASKNPYARELAARLEWEPFVPPWVEEARPGAALDLAGGDVTLAPSAYDAIAGSGARMEFLEAKALREGLGALKRHALARIRVEALHPLRVSRVLDALLAWDAGTPGDVELEGTAVALVLSAGPEHADRLGRLSSSREPAFAALARIVRAALGDEAARPEALKEIDAADRWRRLAAAKAFARAPWPPAGPALRGLARKEWPSALAALDALTRYPEVEATDELLGIVSRKPCETEPMQDALKTAALHLMALRKIDAGERLWELVRDGTLQYEHAWFGLRDEGPDRSSLPGRLAQALLAPDEPAMLDLIHPIGLKNSWFGSALETELKSGAPPRVHERLHLLSERREYAPQYLAALADDYFFREEPKPPDLTPARAMEILEKGAPAEKLEKAFWEADRRSEPFLALCRRWMADDAHPLRILAAAHLRSLKVPEATDRLLEFARLEGDAGEALGRLWGEARARPLLLERLRNGKPGGRLTTARMLARLGDEAALPFILEAFRTEGEACFGDGVWTDLKYYPERDFSAELLPLLEGELQETHVDQILRYLRWKDRRDQIPIMRFYVDHPNRELRADALRALGQWRDRESLDFLDQAAVPGAGHELWSILGALEKIDPDRARSRSMILLRGIPGDAHGPALSTLAKTARSVDAPFVARLLRTSSRNDWTLHPLAGRLGGTECRELLLELLAEGSPYAARGLAYLGERRALPILARQLDTRWPQYVFGALDLIVNREHYPDPALRRPFHPHDSVNLPWEETRRRMKEAFGLALAAPASGNERWAWFLPDYDFVEVLEQLCGTTVRGPEATHLWRDGRVEIVPADEARAHWKSWWDLHRAEFEKK